MGAFCQAGYPTAAVMDGWMDGVHSSTHLCVCSRVNVGVYVFFCVCVCVRTSVRVSHYVCSVPLQRTSVVTKPEDKIRALLFKEGAGGVGWLEGWGWGADSGC